MNGVDGIRWCRTNREFVLIATRKYVQASGTNGFSRVRFLLVVAGWSMWSSKGMCLE